MRLGTFMMGSIFGAAAIIYLSRKNMLSMQQLDASGQMIDSAMDKAKSRIQGAAMRALDMGINSMDRRSKKSDENKRYHASSSKEMKKESEGFTDLNTVKEIIDQDPELKRAVDEIMEHSGQSH